MIDENERLINCRGVRGATTCPANTEEAILAATRDLLNQIVDANRIDPADLASVFFTATTDLNAAYPAIAARQLGWTDIALLCAQEIDVPNGMPMTIRVLLHWNTTRKPDEIKHMYINGTESLRPDLVEKTLNASKL